MGIFGYVFAFSLTILSGYLLLRLVLSGAPKTFYAIEYGVYSFLVGVVLIPFVLFLFGRMGGTLSLMWMLILVLGLTTFLLILNIVLKTKISFVLLDIKHQFLSFPSWLKLGSFIFLVWLLVKLFFGFIDITHVPTYQDDTFGNRNYRAKVFYERESLVLDSKDKDFLGQGYKQYPLTPSLYKTYLIKFTGTRNEGLVNLPSFMFYICALLLVFFVLLRQTQNLKRAGLGLFMLSAIPLYYVHGTNPYFDVFQSVYFFAALSIFYIFIQNKLPFALPILFIGMLGYTKSEGLLIFTVTVFATYILRYLIKDKGNITKEVLNRFFIIIGGVLLINLPFIIFKLSYGLGFGSGEANVAQTVLSLHTEIFPALYRALFVGGSYNLLFSSFVIALVYVLFKKRLDKHTTLWFLLGFFIAFVTIIFIYLTTFTYQYVLDQTGINRSMMQIIPVLVFVLVLLVRDGYESTTE